MSGGGTVTITGTNFGNQSNTTVQFGGNSITPISVTTTQLTFTVPSRPTAGSVPVRVQTPNGLSNTLVYTYIPSVGDSYLGGIIYETNGAHGKVVSATDSNSRQWITGITENVSTDFDNGAQNTTNIMAQPECTTTDNCAARFCREGPGFDANWYLPAIHELEAIDNSGVLNTSTLYYWSSSQEDESPLYRDAWGRSFQIHSTYSIGKNGSWYARCVRAF